MAKCSASSAAEVTRRHTSSEAPERERVAADGNAAAGMLSSAGMGELHWTRSDLQQRLHTLLSGARLATRTASLRGVGIHATLGHVSGHLSIDAFGVDAVRRHDVFHQAAGHRTEGHYKGEDPNVDRATASLH